MTIVGKAVNGFWNFSCLALIRDTQIRKAVERLMIECRMGSVAYVDDLDHAMTHLCSPLKTDIVLCDAIEFAEDHLALTTFVRWSEHSKDFTTPVVVFSNVWTMPGITAARDAGASALMIMPMAFHALFRRFMTVRHADRPFIESEYYRGPDRRLKTSPAYAGPYRRTKDRMILRTPNVVEPTRQRPSPPIPPHLKDQIDLSATNQAELYSAIKKRQDQT